jgi:hypothetical protein
VSLLVALLFLFAACEKEDFGGANGGVQGTIRVDFTIGEIAYGENEVVARGAGPARKSETVVAAVTEDIYMYATLAEEVATGEAEEEALRAEVIPVGNRLRIVAYKKNGGTYAYESNAEYVVAAGGIVPVSEHPVGLLLAATGTYKFVAYSINAATVPSYAASIGAISPGDSDLLWGETVDIGINEVNNNVNINMKHKFSRVTVEVTTASSAGTPSIDAVSAEMAGYKASLTVASGALAKDGGFTQNYLASEWTGTGGTTATSDPHLVFTGDDNPVSVKINSLTLAGMAYSTTVPVTKFGMKLEPGCRYTLSIDLRKVIFAGSNVYWKWKNDVNHGLGGYLTFDAPGGTNQARQGVLFLCGSLVGISGAGSDGSAYSSSGTKAYVPNFTSAGVSDWENPDSYQFDISGMTYFAGEDQGDDSYGAYLSKDAHNTANNYAHWKARKGDICRYISENNYGPEEGGARYKYRMPTAYELAGTVANRTYATGDWVKTPSTTWGSESGSAGGDVALTHYATNKTITFPASGFRDNPTAILNDVGKTGRYWSSSVLLANEFGCAPYSLYVEDNGVNRYINSGPWFFSVRCVKN